MLVNDDTYQRRVMFEEINPNMPGQQFYQFIFFFSTNTMYQITMSNAGQPAACTKNTIPFPYRPVRWFCMWLRWGSVLHPSASCWLRLVAFFWFS